MSEVPHCPDCKRADKVTTRAGPGYEYYCRKCDRVIKSDDIVDGPFIDMVNKRQFNDYEEVVSNAEFEFSDDCGCGWCERGRPGLENIREELTE